MTQADVARRLGITVRAYQHYESGDRPGKIQIWNALEDLFCMPQRILRLNY